MLISPSDTDEPADPKQAPGDLERLRGFVNTLDIDERTETLDSPEAVQRWLAENDLGCEPPAEVTADDLVRLRAFREALRDFIELGPALRSESRELMEREMQRSTLRMVFCGDNDSDVRITPAGEGVSAAIAWMMVLIRSAQLEGTWPRLKVCQSHDCRWAFYDASKNASSQWCSMRVCGNRAKARRYRERRAAGQA